MSKQILITIILSMVFGNVISQTPFNKIYDFSNGTDSIGQLKGSALYETEDRLIVGGIAVYEYDNIGHRHPMVASFYKDGTRDKLTVWPNPNGAIVNFMDFPNDIIEMDGDLFMAVAHIGEPSSCIAKINPATLEVSTFECVQDSMNYQLLSVESLVEFPQGHQTVLLRAVVDPNFDTEIRSSVTAQLPVDRPKAYVLADIINYRTGIVSGNRKIIRISDTKAIILGAYYTNGDLLDWGMHVISIDENLEIIERKILYDDCSSGRNDIDGVLTSDHHIVTTLRSFDRTHYDTTGQRLHQPTVLKLDTNLNVVWREPVGPRGFTSRAEGHYSLVESHSGDGYIYVGVDGAFDNARMGKISSGGDSLWHYEVSTFIGRDSIETELLDDVIPTSDGYYTACGSRFGARLVNDSINSFIQLWLLKFDDDGNIVNVGQRVSTDEVGEEDGLDIIVYPNPSVDFFFIKQEEAIAYNYQLYDMSGKLIASKQSSSEVASITILDMTSYASGMYHLIIQDTKGNVVKQEKLVKQ